MSGAGRIVVLGDSCIALHLGEAIDPAVNSRCIALAGALEDLALDGVRDVVPAYSSVTVHFDPWAVDGRSVVTALRRLEETTSVGPDVEKRTVEIPVAYGGASGPDLAAVARFAGCSEPEVVRIHTEATYRVYMLGFLPGFAYMGSVDPRIAMPRLEAPRPRVAAGSVGIAGEQTGIYPCDTPGGWRIIGRTPANMFDASRSEPVLLKAGDLVTFVAA